MPSGARRHAPSTTPLCTPLTSLPIGKVMQNERAVSDKLFKTLAKVDTNLLGTLADNAFPFELCHSLFLRLNAFFEAFYSSIRFIQFIEIFLGVPRNRSSLHDLPSMQLAP